ncbi:unnamed protein product [Callosobruchus maculatus]|uniref:Fibronectin type-III domain-containing protein n=1 Tax=Callosobruchus maculatus TaxID=64391 RepID=A0A653CKN0_CALMS|nr:unnamed protein product [Callosobruchus maculatus]
MNYIWFLCLLVSAVSLEFLDADVESQCIENCSQQNQTDKVHYGYACDHSCHIDQCTKGCSLWKQALSRTCHEACQQQSPQTPQPPAALLYCTAGCSDALSRYSAVLRGAVGRPPAPALLADSLAPTHLRLEWRPPKLNALAALGRHVQWRYEDAQPQGQHQGQQQWQYARAAKWDADGRTVLVEGLQPYSKYRDVPPDNSFVMVRDLHPGKNYTIEIRMRNKRGSGPPAVATVSTPTEPQTKDVEQPPLMLGTEYSILELTHILDEPTNVYRSPRNVPLRGISLHINKKLLFITDTLGYVSKIILKDDTRLNILTPQNLDFMPLDLTVDWLNDHLYIIGEIKYEMQKYVIKRCDINGDALITVQSGLYVKPSSIQVDPINGYLFWTLQDYSKGGLYRMDIADIDGPTKYYDKVKRIVNETDLGAFTFEYNNFNVLLSFQKQNTIKSVTLDGKEIKDIRTSVISPKLQKVISLVMANKKFYWTDGVDVFMEEYHEDPITGSKSYFHNTIPHLTNGAYKKVFINLPSSQPWPTPINPPTNLQAIFESNAAKTRWQAPRLVGLQGKGAWQNWTYEMMVTEANSLKTIIKTGINASNFIITDLKESTEYILKIAAYTKSGRSPWSSEFRGYTLKNASNKSILWSTSDSLLQSNVAGEEITTVLDKKRHRLKMEFTDITWHKDKIYIVTNNSQVLWYNMTNRELGKLMDVDSILSMAVDWIGEKLYWSNPKQQLIVRGNFNGTEQEPLLTVLAKELHIDAVEAYIYWSSGIKIECARLNGMDKFEYHDVQYFSGKQIMGMTLDSEDKFVYWIVRGSEGSTLYKAPMKGYHDKAQFSVKPVSNLQKATVLGPLCYFHKRLLWLQDDRSAAVSDLSGKNIATISGKRLKKLNLVYIMDPSLHVIPEGFDSWNRISVTPEPVDNSSVRVTGSSKSFNITWDSVKDVNYGTVFYEVQIDTPMKLRNYSTMFVTTESYIKYPDQIMPFTRMTVTVRPFTYWSTAAQTRAFIFSPPSTPSAPINPRIFVAHTHRYDEYQRTELEMARVTVRWDPPQDPNGVLKGYRVKCYYVEDDAVVDVCVDASTEASKREFKLDELVRGVIYHFTIQAYTEVGSGEISPLVSANTSIESPIPILIISKNESVFIDDMDKNLTTPLAENIAPPVKLTHISRENKTFWINTKKEIVLFDMQSYTQSTIFEIEGEPLGMTVDWLERSIYYVQIKDGKSSVHKLDLNLLDNQMKQMKVLEVDGTIYNIKMSPLTQRLYWLEGSSNKFKLMESSSDGSNIKSFFQDSNYPSSCNCPHFIELGPCFTVDTSDIDTPLIIFMDVLSDNILSTPDGCFCSVVVNNELVREASPVRFIETDYSAVYWANEDYIYFLKRSEGQILTKQSGVTDLTIYGQHIQPHPQHNASAQSNRLHRFFVVCHLDQRSPPYAPGRNTSRLSKFLYSNRQIHSVLQGRRSR